MVVHAYASLDTSAAQSLSRSAPPLASSPTPVMPFVPAATMNVKPLDPAKLGALLILAPHPDDESLGCGGLIAAARQAGNTVEIVIVTDGSKSHPRSQTHPPRKLAAIRRAETRLAALELGVAPANVHDLGYGDAELPQAHERRLEELTAHFSELIERFRPETVLVPWMNDPHRDHRSVTAAAYAVRRSPRVFRMLEYPIWANARLGTSASVDASRRIYGVDIRDVLARKRAAVERHRTQTSGLIADDPTGFRLTPAMLSEFLRPTEYFFEAS